MSISSLSQCLAQSAEDFVDFIWYNLYEKEFTVRMEVACERASRRAQTGRGREKGSLLCFLLSRARKYLCVLSSDHDKVNAVQLLKICLKVMVR